MPLSTSESTRFLRPRNNPTSTSDPRPRTQCLSQSSDRKNGCQDSKKLLTERPKKKKTLVLPMSLEGMGCCGSSVAPPKKKKILFLSLTLKRIGCRGSSVASAPAVIRSAAEWEAEKVSTRKKTKKQSKTSSSPSVPEVCCAPGVGVASDVIPRARAPQRNTHRPRSGLSRRGGNNETTMYDTNQDRSDASNVRELNRQRRQSPPQIVMFQQNLLAGGSLDGYDQYGDWRLDVDNMSYEELLDLSERIGYVRTGLKDQIYRCLRKSKHSILESLPLLTSTDKDWKCSICQDGWKADNKLGRLACGHYHHLRCIKQWLLQKNACPICKTLALADK